MITLKMTELKKLSQSFNELIEKDLTVNTAWDLSEIQSILVEKETLYNGMVKKLIEKYSEKDESGGILIEDGSYIIKPDFVEEFNTQVAELMKIEFTLKCDKIHIDRLVKSDGKPIDISSNTLFNLKAILTR